MTSAPTTEADGETNAQGLPYQWNVTWKRVVVLAVTINCFVFISVMKILAPGQSALWRDHSQKMISSLSMHKANDRHFRPQGREKFSALPLQPDGTQYGELYTLLNKSINSQRATSLGQGQNLLTGAKAGRHEKELIKVRKPSLPSLSTSLYRSLLTVSPRWKPLDRHNAQLYVYSAHFDDTGHEPLVVSLLTGPGRAKSFPVVCLYFQFQHEPRPSGMVVGECQNYTTTKMRLGIYHGAFVKCPLLSPSDRPYAVSVFAKNVTFSSSMENYDAFLTNLMVIHYSGRRGIGTKLSGTRGSYRWNLTKCFPAMFRWMGLMGLMQQIEVHRLLGVQHFTFYVFSAAPTIKRLLQYYAKQGVVDVLDWTLPKPEAYPNHTTRSLFAYFNQMDVVQDCLLRHLRSSRYALFGDLDEIFVPRSENNLLSLLNRLFRQEPHCGGFLFRNTFFDPLKQDGDDDSNGTHYDDGGGRRRGSGGVGVGGEVEIDDDEEEEDGGDEGTGRDWRFAQEHKLRSLLLVYRVKEVWEAGSRSKPVVMPTRVNVTGVHAIKSFRGNYSQCTVSPSEGLLHHYRRVPNAEGKTHTPRTLSYVKDTYLRRFSSRIVKRMKNVLQDFQRFGGVSEDVSK